MIYHYTSQSMASLKTIERHTNQHWNNYLTIFYINCICSTFANCWYFLQLGIFCNNLGTSPHVLAKFEKCSLTNDRTNNSTIERHTNQLAWAFTCFRDAFLALMR